MKHIFGTLILSAFILLLVASLAAPIAVQAGSPFNGAWWAIDVPDGSYMKLMIGGGGRANKFNVHYIDFGASVCGKDANDQPLYAATISGKGKANGNTLDVGVVSIYCLAHPKYVWGTTNMWFEYNPATDTLWDGWVTWHRMGK